MHIVLEYIGWVVNVISFVSDLVTVILGAIALYGIVKHRKAFGAFLAVLASTQLQERNRRIRETATRLNGLDYEQREHKREVIALLGQLCGQITPQNDRDALKLSYEKLEQLLSSPGQLTESKKRQIVYEIDGILDLNLYAASKAILESKE